MPVTAPGRIRVHLEGRPDDLDTLKAHLESTLNGVITEATVYAPANADDDPTAAHQMVLYVQLNASPTTKAEPPEEKPSWMPSSQPEPVSRVEYDRRGQIARQFVEVEKQLRTLNRMSQDGLIQRREFMRRLRALIVTDDKGVQWMMNSSADGWLKFTGEGGWIPAVPDVLDPDQNT